MARKYDLSKSVFDNINANLGEFNETDTDDAVLSTLIDELSKERAGKKIPNALGVLQELPSDYNDLDNPEQLKKDLLEFVSGERKNKKRGGIPFVEQLKKASPANPENNKIDEKFAQLISAGTGGAIGGGLLGALVSAGLQLPGEPPPVFSGENLSNLVGGVASRGVQSIGLLDPVKKFMSQGGAASFLPRAAGGAFTAGVTEGSRQGFNKARFGDDFDPTQFIISTVLGSAGDVLIPGMLAHGTTRAGTPKLREIEKNNPYLNKDLTEILKDAQNEALNAETTLQGAATDIAKIRNVRPQQLRDQINLAKKDFNQKFKDYKDVPDVVQTRDASGKFLKTADINNQKKLIAEKNKLISDHNDVIKGLRAEIAGLPNEEGNILSKINALYKPGVVGKFDPIREQFVSDLRREFADPGRLRKLVEGSVAEVFKAGKEGAEGGLSQRMASDQIKSLVEFTKDLTGNDRAMQEALTKEFVTAFGNSTANEAGTKNFNRINPVIKKMITEVFPTRPKAFEQITELAKSVDKINKAIERKTNPNLRFSGGNLGPRAWINDLMGMISPSVLVDSILQGESRLNQFNLLLKQVNRLIDNPMAGGDIIQATIRAGNNFLAGDKREQNERNRAEKNIIKLNLSGRN